MAIKKVRVVAEFFVEVDDNQLEEHTRRYLDKAIDNGLESGLGGDTGIEITRGWEATTEITLTDAI